MRLADVEFSTHGKALVAQVSGEIDVSNATQLGGVLTDATGNELLALVLDLSAVDYLDSAGIQLIYRLEASLKTRGQTLWLVIPDGSPVRYSLRLAGLASHVEMLQSVEEALGGVEPLSA
jgi:anti-sigma B factor antagonist